MGIVRCSFGECSTSIGSPIIEHVTEAYGGVWGLCYSIFVFFITIGFFNVITAIFLESTTTAAVEVNLRKERMRLSDRKLWAGSVATIIRKILAMEPCGLPPDGKLSTFMEEILQVEVSRVDLNKLIKEDKDVKQVLHNLDIETHDHNKIGDILDVSHKGSISILDLVNGLKRLRGGNLKRSDVVSIDLMLQSLQEQVKGLSRDIFWLRTPQK